MSCLASRANSAIQWRSQKSQCATVDHTSSHAGAQAPQSPSPFAAADVGMNSASSPSAWRAESGQYQECAISELMASSMHASRGC